MRGVAFVTVTSAFVLLLTMNADAQVPLLATPVPHCMHECAPRDKDVNGPGVATSGPVKVILYGHFEDILNIAPLNTQAPDPVHEKDLNGKFLMPILHTDTGVCTPSPLPRLCPDLQFINNQFVMESSPGLVEYLSDGSWRTHQEPGLGAPIRIAAKTFNLYWYLSAHALPNHDSTHQPGADVRVGIMAQVSVYARIETGRFNFKGELVAESRNVSDMGFGSPQRVNMVTLPAGDEVYEFQVPMFVKNDGVIPRAKGGFIVYVNPYQYSSDYKGSTQFGQEEWRFRTGPKFPPRVVVPVEEPLRGAGIQFFPDNGSVIVRAGYLASFGAYDANRSAMRLDVSGSRPVPSNASQFLRTSYFSNDYDGVFKPVNATWRIDVAPAQLDGDRIQVTFQNYQDTFKVVQSAIFHVTEYRGLAASPGPSSLWALAGIVVVAFLVRRPS